MQRCERARLEGKGFKSKALLILGLTSLRARIFLQTSTVYLIHAQKRVYTTGGRSREM